METKSWFSDQAVVTGLLTALMGIYVAIRAAVPSLPEVNPAIVGSIIAILAGIGIFGRATDSTKPKLGLKTKRR